MTWSKDWTFVTQAFRSLASRHGVIEHYPLGGEGPNGEALTLDAALIGPRDAERCLILSAGLHGVEGIAGSAILRAWLAGRVPRNRRIVLLHLLNPFGFAWTRRVDGDNIDLNRNFLLAGEDYDGHPPGWDRIVDGLSPERPISRTSVFWPSLMASLARLGYRRLAEAVAGGQHTHPRALFFGGHGPSELQRLLRRQLPCWMAGAREVLHLDFHTGLGPRGRLRLLLPRQEGTDEALALQRRFGEDAMAASARPRYFRTRGALGPWCEALLPDTRYTLCPAEFGTCPSFMVLAALHYENRAYFWNPHDSASAQWARRQLEQAFAPDSPQWRSRVLERGTRLIDQALLS